MVVIHNRSLQWLYWDLYKDSVPAPIWGPKIRWCIITKNVAACVCGIWDLCKEGLGLKASESSHRYECLLSPRKNHWSCNVHQKSKMSKRRHARKREQLLRNRKWLFWDLPISVGKSTNIAFWVLVMQCLRIEETRCCSNRSIIGVICKSASSARHCLLSRERLSICVSISLSPIHLTASLYFWYLCPADCSQEITFEQARTSHSNNLGFFGHIKTDYSGRTQFFDRKVGINISDPCTRESKNKFGSKRDAFGADNYEQ